MDRKQIEDLLMTNDRAVARALLVLYRDQTDRERATEQTTESNGVGFNSADARMYGSMARQVQRGYSLSPNQLSFLRKKRRILKYSGQLLNAAKKKAQSE